MFVPLSSCSAFSSAAFSLSSNIFAPLTEAGDYTNEAGALKNTRHLLVKTGVIGNIRVLPQKIPFDQSLHVNPALWSPEQRLLVFVRHRGTNNV